MKYLCTYKIPFKNDENRYFALSAVDKADFLIDLMLLNGYSVDIISDSRTLSRTGKFKERTDILGENITLTSEKTIGANSRLEGVFQKIQSIIWLTRFLMKKCKRKECIFVYHSVFYVIPLLFVRLFRRIRIILEVEEVFYNLGKTSFFRKSLEKQIFRKADAFVFSSLKMNNLCNSRNKPFIVINGVCDPVYVSPIKRQNNDGKIILLYAGLIKKNGAAFKCLDIARHLDSRFVLKIIGYGIDEDINLLKNAIKQTNNLSNCFVEYGGVKREKEYHEYVQKCDVGLCPLTTDKAFQSSCFPSKILSYLSNGLSVVTTENSTIRDSSFSEYIIYSDSDDPFIFAQSIINNFNRLKCDYRDKLNGIKEKNASDIGELFLNV